MTRTALRRALPAVGVLFALAAGSALFVLDSDGAAPVAPSFAHGDLISRADANDSAGFLDLSRVSRRLSPTPHLTYTLRTWGRWRSADLSCGASLVVFRSGDAPIRIVYRAHELIARAGELELGADRVGHRAVRVRVPTSPARDQDPAWYALATSPAAPGCPDGPVAAGPASFIDRAPDHGRLG